MAEKNFFSQLVNLKIISNSREFEKFTSNK